MFDFSDDEWAFFAAAVVVVLAAGFIYYRQLLSVSFLKRSGIRCAVLACVPAVALSPTAIVLLRWADPQVVGHQDYQLLFLIGGAAWILLTAQWVGWIGISLRADAIERDNPAALCAITGIVLGVGLVYACSNIGSGPTIWTTLVPALAGTGMLFVVVAITELFAGDIGDAITIDRDIASGLRLAGVAFGSAIIIGHAAAGDFVSWQETWIDFARRGWPAMVLAIFGPTVHRIQRPTPQRPRPDLLTCGVIPATLFVVLGIAAIVF